MQLLSKFTGFLSGDLIFLLVAIVLFISFSLFFGKKTTISLVLAYYPALVLYKIFPFIDRLTFFHGNQLEVLNKIAIFLILLAPLCIIISRYIVDSEYSKSSHLLRIAGLSLAGIILIVLFSYAVVNFDSLHDFGTQIDALFGSPDRIFYWSLAPLIILAFL